MDTNEKTTIDFINLDKGEKIDSISATNLFIKDVNKKIAEIEDKGFMLVTNNVTSNNLKEAHYLTVTFRKVRLIHIDPAGGPILPPRFRKE